MNEWMNESNGMNEWKLSYQHSSAWPLCWSLGLLRVNGQLWHFIEMWLRQLVTILPQIMGYKPYLSLPTRPWMSPFPVFLTSYYPGSLTFFQPQSPTFVPFRLWQRTVPWLPFQLGFAVDTENASPPEKDGTNAPAEKDTLANTARPISIIAPGIHVR